MMHAGGKRPFKKKGPEQDAEEEAEEKAEQTPILTRTDTIELARFQATKRRARVLANKEALAEVGAAKQAVLQAKLASCSLRKPCPPSSTARKKYTGKKKGKKDGKKKLVEICPSSPPVALSLSSPAGSALSPRPPSTPVISYPPYLMNRFPFQEMRTPHRVQKLIQTHFEGKGTNFFIFPSFTCFL